MAPPVDELVAELGRLWLRPSDTSSVRADKLSRRAVLAERLAEAVGTTDLDSATSLAVAGVLRDVRAGGTRYVELAQALARDAAAKGHPDGGRVYAEITDLLCNLRFLPQRYGTLTFVHHGERVLTPVHPDVTDAERAELGLPGLAAVVADVHAHNRRLAEQAAVEPGLPEGAELRRVWRGDDPADLLRRCDADGPVWRDGDELVVVWQGDADGVRTTGGLQLPMWRLDGSDVWLLRVRIRRLDEAVVGLGFVVDAPGGGARYESADLCWRGPDAPPAPARRRPLAGRLREAALPGPLAGEERAVTAYLPPGHDPRASAPVVYLADGGTTGYLAEVVDAAVVAGDLPPVVLVGVAAGLAAGEDRRNDEYLAGRHPGRFEAHRAFFVDEVAAWAEAELGVAADRRRRGVFGTSSGGAFAVTVGLRHADRFGSVIAFSLGFFPPDATSWPPGAVPAHYLAAGTLEQGFRRSTANWAAAVTTAGGECVHVEPVSGHDVRMWEAQLPLALGWAFA